MSHTNKENECDKPVKHFTKARISSYVIVQFDQEYKIGG